MQQQQQQQQLIGHFSSLTFYWTTAELNQTLSPTLSKVITDAASLCHTLSRLYIYGLNCAFMFVLELPVYFPGKKTTCK